MDLNNLKIEEILAGIATIIVGFSYLRKKFTFDNLEIAKSEAERELVQILREQVAIANTEIIDLKKRYEEMEKNARTIAVERDEALKEITIYKDDILRLDNKIKVLEGIISRLTDALEITSEKLDNE